MADDPEGGFGKRLPLPQPQRTSVASERIHAHMVELTDCFNIPVGNLSHRHSYEELRSTLFIVYLSRTVPIRLSNTILLQSPTPFLWPLVALAQVRNRREKAKVSRLSVRGLTKALKDKQVLLGRGESSTADGTRNSREGKGLGEGHDGVVVRRVQSPAVVGSVLRLP